jgi:succinyl-diaminopimelate desuccinylase
MSHDVLVLAQDLIRLDTRNPGSVEHPAAELVAERLRAAGCTVELHAFGEGRTSVVARCGDASGPVLGLTGHLDTVPLGQAEWSVEPHGAEVRDGLLYGRGATDMKAGIAAIVIAVEQHLAASAVPAALEIVLTAGEETGCEGAIALVDAGLLSPRLAGLLVAEPTENTAVVAHKGVLWLEVLARGRSAHGSMPELGDNAAYRLAAAALALRDRPTSSLRHPMLGAPSLSVGTMRAGSNTNSVPDRAEATVDLRTLPGQSHAEELADVRRLLQEIADAPLIEVSPILDLPGIDTSPSDPFVTSVLAAIAGVTGAQQAPGAATYFTDASVLTPRYGDVPTVVCGPGDPAQAHQTDEHCRIDRIIESLAIFRRVIDGWPHAAIEARA